MKWLSLAAVTVFLAGCQTTPPEEGTTPPTESSPNAATSSTEPSGDSGVQIHGAGAGGLAPVTGTESLQGGGGGGVGAAATDRARSAASGASGRSYNLDGE